MKNKVLSFLVFFVIPFRVKDIADSQDTTEEMTEIGSLNGLMKCDFLYNIIFYPAYSVNDNVLNYGKDTGVKILPQSV